MELINRATEHKMFRQTDPFVDDSDIVGRTNDISKALHMLINIGDENDLSVIGIVGMPGQGKTTLAKLAYRDEKVVSYFDMRIWICVSDDFVVEKLLNEMLQSLKQVKSELTNREAMVKKLREHLNGKRYLLVLDDVWNEDRDKWDSMRNCLLEVGGSKGSKVMIYSKCSGLFSNENVSYP